MNAIEQQVLEHLHNLETGQQQIVLEFIQSLAHDHTYTALYMTTLPIDEQKRAVEKAFELARDEDFEIFDRHAAL